MKKRKASQRSSNLKLAVAFFAFVFSVILTSFLIRGAMMVKESIYDGSGRFTLKVSDGKNAQLISFSKTSSSISILTIEGQSKNANIGHLLSIPIDGFLEASFFSQKHKVPSLLSQALLHQRSVKTNLTVLDLLRLFLFSRSVSPVSIQKKSVDVRLSSLEIDKAIGRLFTDELIEKEKNIIEIVNGTEVGGLGNRLARLVTNMGGDVVIVKTADAPQNTSFIAYTANKSYTVERLSRVLRFKALKKTEEKTLADITITVGKDKLSSLPF